MTYETDREKLQDIGKKLANQMGWDFILDDWRIEIAKDDLLLYLRIEKNRLRIDAGFPGLSQYFWRIGNREKNDITVSLTKSIDQTVKDIERRLLPIYRKQLAEVKEIKRKDDEYQENKKRIMGKVAFFVNDAQIATDNETISGYRPDLKVKWGSGCLQLQIDLSAEQIIEVLKVVNNFKEKSHDQS